MRCQVTLGRGGEQRVVVEHVHIHADRQAIVGAVTHTGAPRALMENQEQPRAANEALRSTQVRGTKR